MIITKIWNYLTKLMFKATEHILNYLCSVCNVSWKTYAFCVRFCIFKQTDGRSFNMRNMQWVFAGNWAHVQWQSSQVTQYLFVQHEAFSFQNPPQHISNTFCHPNLQCLDLDKSLQSMHNDLSVANILTQIDTISDALTWYPLSTSYKWLLHLRN